jgi:tetratricopeptide (TPR) repeat protein
MNFSRAANLFFLLLILSACSTEKNTYVNRKYHSVTAKYNGYFNANELITQSMRTFKTSYKEDFYVVLPIERLPNEKEVEGILPSIDTAISKCTKVIQNHSMPSIKGSYKKVEHNTYIDENFITVGVANYYKRNYEDAAKNFEFISRLFAKDKSNYIAQLWQARIFIEQGNYSDALTNIESLEDVVEEQYGNEDSGKKGSSSSKKSKTKSKGKSKSKSKKKSKSKDNKEEPAKFPNHLRDDLLKVKAEYYLKKNEIKLAIESLEKAAELSRKKEKARIYFILGQLYTDIKNPGKANESYSKCLNYPAPYVMHFNAKMNKALSGKDKGIKKQLIRMVKEAKNQEYKDQIYYALASIELQEKNRKQAMIYLTQSAKSSTTNKRQKAMSYEKMGDLSFEKSNYIAAQKYYDSCGTVMPENYPNGEDIKSKAAKLSKLVTAVETANFEDSVQRIAMMSESDRTEYLEDVLKQIKLEKARQKRLEEQKLQEMQEALNKQNEASGKKGYWNNNKTRQEGLTEFKKTWGDRENEDDWRRSEKIDLSIGAIEDGEDSLAVDKGNPKEDSLTVEMLAKNLPLTEEAMKASTDKLLNAWYDAAVIYKEELNEADQAAEYFEKITSKKLVNNLDLSASFQLYRLNEGKSGADGYKNHILTTYPKSDFAAFLLDPEYFLKQKNKEKENELDYLKIYSNYTKKNYNLVINEIDAFLITQPQTKLKSKFKLLRVNAQANLTVDKKELLPALNEIVTEFPDTDEEKRAKEMIKIIQEGFSKNDSIVKKVSPYKYQDEAIHYIIVVADKALKVNDVQTKINALNTSKFSNLKLKSSTLVLSDATNLVLLKEFKSLKKGKDYVTSYKASKREMGKFNELKVFLISAENLKKLLELKKIEEYELFHDENY